MSLDVAVQTQLLHAQVVAVVAVVGSAEEPEETTTAVAETLTIQVVAEVPDLLTEAPLTDRSGYSTEVHLTVVVPGTDLLPSLIPSIRK